MELYTLLDTINERPKPFEFYTASDLWTDEHTSEQMLAYHLNEDIDASSRSGAFIDRSVAWIISRFGVDANTKIADFGCGPGLYTVRFARHGTHVTGIDFSKRSIAYARETAARENLRIEYINLNYLEFDTDERYDLITMIMCDFCALSPEQRHTMLKKFHTLLKPGGAVLLDVYSLNAFNQREEAAMYEENQLNGFWSPDPYYGFLNTFKYTDDHVMLDKYTIVEAHRIRTVYNWLQYFSPEMLEQEFQQAGLVIDTSYSDVAGSPYDPETAEFAVVARKR